MQPACRRLRLLHVTKPITIIARDSDMITPVIDSSNTPPARPRWKHPLACCILIFGWLSMATIAYALESQDPWQTFAEPWFDQSGISNDLPNRILTALAQDSEDTLWIGSFNGLARYDGQHVYLYPADGSKPDGLPDAYIRTLLTLDDDRLLLGTNTSGLLVFDSTTEAFTHIALPGPQGEARKIFSVRKAANGVWVGSDQGLFHFDPVAERVVAVDSISSGYSSTIFDIAEDGQGRLWLGGNPGLFVREPGQTRFQHYPLGEALDRDVIWRLYLDDEQHLWVGSGSQGLVRLDTRHPDAPVKHLAEATELAAGRTIRAFARGPDGALWIGTEGSGAIVCPDLECQRPRSFKTSGRPGHVLAGDAVRDLLLDASGILWLATSQGLTRHQPEQEALRVLDGADHLIPSNRSMEVTAILVDDRDRVWLGTDGLGLILVDLAQATAQHLALPGLHAEQNNAGLLQDPHGTIRLGGLGVLDIDPDSLAIANSIPGLSSRRITHLANHDGGLLVSTHDGVQLYDLKNDPSRQPMDIVPRDHSNHHLRQVRWTVKTDTRRWYASVDGLFVVSETSGEIDVERTRPGDTDSLPNSRLSMLAHDPAQHRLWVAGDGGLTWLDLRQQTAPLRFHRLPDAIANQRVNAVILDTQGAIWASGDDRLFRVDGTDFSIREITRRDGLRPGVFRDRAMALGSQGRVLVGSSAGLIVIRPEALTPSSTTPAPLRISRVTLNGHRVLAPRPGQIIELEASERQLLVDFSLRDFRSPEEVRYHYRLLGAENDWHDIAPRTPASAIYTNLPTGQFVLQLRATMRGQETTLIQQDYPLTVAPRHHETWPARILQGALALLAIAALISIGMRWSQRRQRLLDQLVAERTRELNVANAQLEALARLDPLTGLNNRRYLLEVSRRAVHEAHQHQHPLSLLLLDMDHFKTVNDEYGHLAGDAVLRAVARVVMDHCRDTDYAGRYGGEEIVICLPNVGIDNALTLAERLRQQVQGLRIRFGETDLQVTCSIGVAQLEGQQDTFETLFERADRAMYAAKNKRRNRVEADHGIPTV